MQPGRRKASFAVIRRERELDEPIFCLAATLDTMPAQEATMIELTDDQARLMQSQNGPVQVLNPHTQETYFLIRKDVYDLVRSIVEGPNRRGWDNPADDDLIRKKAGIEVMSSQSIGRSAISREPKSGQP